MTARIIGTGSYIPEKVITNEDLTKLVDTSDEWITSRTGIKKRHITNDGTTFMAAKAAKRACADAGIIPADLDIIILATTTADHCFPSGACEVQGVIGAVNAVAFDISAACSGFIYALHILNGFFKAGLYKTGLVIGAESLSKLMDWKDRSTCVLFGDGAGAAVVQAEDLGIMETRLYSDGSKTEVLNCKTQIYMNGQEVFKFAVKKVPESIEEVLASARIEKEAVKYFILHQANERIIASVAKRLEISMDKVPLNISEYANTSAASIPILLDELNREHKLNKGDLLVLSGFGAGLTWGTTLLAW